MLGEKEKFYLISAAILLIGALLAWQGIISGQAAIDRNIEEIQDKKVTIGAYDLREKGLPYALENYDYAKREADKLNDLFVDENNLPDFIGELETIAALTSNSLGKSFESDPVSASSKPPSKSAKKGTISEESDGYILRLTLKGNFTGLMNFISRLESMPYYIYIRSLEINASFESKDSFTGAKGASIGNLQSVLVIKVFTKRNINE